MLSDGGGGDERRSDRGISKSQRGGNPGHLRVETGRPNVDRADGGAQGWLAVERLPGERSGAQLGAGGSSGYPRVALRGSELLFAWTDSTSSLRVQTASARLP